VLLFYVFPDALYSSGTCGVAPPSRLRTVESHMTSGKNLILHQLHVSVQSARTGHGVLMGENSSVVGG
jgi:hypothetical protein